jgi:hypothetical protein
MKERTKEKKQHVITSSSRSRQNEPPRTRAPPALTPTVSGAHLALIANLVGDIRFFAVVEFECGIAIDINGASSGNGAEHTSFTAAEVE